MSENPLLQVLSSHHGLLKTSPKVPIRDQFSLSLAYSPGVGHVCEAIKNNIKEVSNLTNRGNSIIIMSDGSGLPESKGSENVHVMPFLETLAVFYKQLFNIDAYPIILNGGKADQVETIVNTIDNLCPCFCGFELFGFPHTRAAKILELCQREYMETLILSCDIRDLIEESISTNLENRYLIINLIVGAFLRAGIDMQLAQVIPKETVVGFLSEFRSELTNLEQFDLYQFAKTVTHRVAKFMLSAHLSHENKSATADSIVKRLELFYNEGKEGWYNRKEFDYVNKDNKLEENAIKLHKAHSGVTSIECKILAKDNMLFKEILDQNHLKKVSEKISQDPDLAFELTCKGNLIAVISNGTAVLGLGDIGPEAGLPVMEGKAVLFKQFGGVDAVPICMREKNPERFVENVMRISSTFAAINLEDIKAPECFEIEESLVKKLDIPIFHDDQHGTAVVVYAGLINALKLAKKKLEDVKIVINGSGAAGISIAEMLLHAGAKDIILADSKGAIYEARKENMNEYKKKLAEMTNPDDERGDLKDILKDADVFIGVSKGGALKKEWIKAMKEKPIIFALANPEPEIWPAEAKEGGAFIVATGRSDLKNHINNSLAFPGIFRGAIDIRAKKITRNMQIAAAKAIAEMIKDDDLNPENIIPNSITSSVAVNVAGAVARQGMEDGVARKKVDPKKVENRLMYYMIHGKFDETIDLGVDSSNKADLP